METGKKTIVLGCDHGGYDLKETLKQYLEQNNYKVEDVGSYTPDRVDYPDYAAKVCEGVQKAGPDGTGVVVCGSGIGISIAANKFKGIRCGLANDYYAALQCRQKDNCNVLSLGCRVIGEETAKLITKTFLETPFDANNAEYNKRMEKLKEIEEKYLKN